MKISFKLFVLFQRFYRTLSEMKSEVESVIKTGRKMVEEKAVPEPQVFSKKIDTLKELYNKLGAQITEAKQMLENALIISREIQNDSSTLNKWLDSVSKGIAKETFDLEMTKMEATKDKLNSNYVQFSKQCDAIYLEPLKESLDKLNNRWNYLKEHGVPSPESDSEDIVKFLKDLQQKLDDIDTLSTEKLSAMKSELEAKQEFVEKTENGEISDLWKILIKKIEVGYFHFCIIMTVLYSNYISYFLLNRFLKQRLKSHFISFLFIVLYCFSDIFKCCSSSCITEVIFCFISPGHQAIFIASQNHNHTGMGVSPLCMLILFHTII